MKRTTKNLIKKIPNTLLVQKLLVEHLDLVKHRYSNDERKIEEQRKSVRSIRKEIIRRMGGDE
jgi:hypothetical protein